MVSYIRSGIPVCKPTVYKTIGFDMWGMEGREAVRALQSLGGSVYTVNGMSERLCIGSYDKARTVWGSFGVARLAQ